ncbi:MAG: YbcC family protein [Leptospirales bacterium]
MNVIDRYDTALKSKVDEACRRIAPLWPLKHFVAVNPYLGLSDQPFWQADKTMRRVAGTGLCMPLEYYREQLASGRITRNDLAAALLEMDSTWDLQSFERELARKETKPRPPFPLLSDILGDLEHRDWSGFVVERISQYCAAYFDEGQALWTMPWKDQSLYRGWIRYASLDRSARMMGLRGTKEVVCSLPESPEDCIARSLGELAVPRETVGDYLHASLLSIGGWAGWTRYRLWQAQLGKGHDDTLRDLLAIRLAWDAILLKVRSSGTLVRKWQAALAAFSVSVAPADPAHQVDAVLQTAFEIGYRRQLITAIASGRSTRGSIARPDAQAIFCIDVRSETFRRALETVSPSVQTLGFAGFFGVLVEYLPFGSAEAKGHLPILFNPSYRIAEVPAGMSEADAGEMAAKRHTRMRASKTWKHFKTSASSCFSFVEAAGILSAFKLVSNSMGWSRPVVHPQREGLKSHEINRIRPVLDSVQKKGTGKAESPATGIPVADRPSVAEFALRNMGMLRDFSRLVLLVGHGSTTANNPQATGLDCGACAGQTGEASARIAAALLNDPSTREGLAKEKGIVIPEDTFFVGALHDTTTDMVQMYDTDTLPASHDEDLRRLSVWLDQAGEMSRLERASLLGTDALPKEEITADILRRTRDWSEVRPEWGLAGNAAFIVAPRSRTSHCDLGGRAFLHEYNWKNDAGFATLQLIMTAPMVVGNWINMQYYGSVVDNLRFGSGNKVLHNVVGGAIGVLEGNGGDLRVGLAIQSLHDGKRWVHEPLRLNVFIEAPQDPIDDVISRHDLVRELIENEWLYFFRIGDDGSIYRRGTDRQWKQMFPDS